MWKHAIKGRDMSTSSPPSGYVLCITQTFIDLLKNKVLGDLLYEYKYLIPTTHGKLHMKTNFMFEQYFRLANSSYITPLTSSV